LEFPHLQKAYEKYQKDGLEIVSINVRETDTPEAIAALWKERGLTWTPVKNAKGGDNDAVAAYKVRGCPTNFLVGKDGKIISSWVGFHPQKGADHLQEEFAKAGFK
jgi:peroxiredoxin